MLRRRLEKLLSEKERSKLRSERMFDTVLYTWLFIPLHVVVTLLSLKGLVVTFAPLLLVFCVLCSVNDLDVHVPLSMDLDSGLFPSARGVELLHARDALLLPGEEAAKLVEQNTKDVGGAEKKRAVVRLGSGMLQRANKLVSTKCGALQLDERRSKVWLDGNQKRYEPALEDMVIGIVTEKHAEEYRLCIRGTDTATLSALAFEGATKRNKPALTVGTAVYCRVTLASKNMEAEVSCIEPGSSKSWVSGETTYGELSGGNIIHVSLALARSLLSRNGTILNMIGSKIPFESAVGVNGRVWIKSDSIQNTVLISSAIVKADSMPNDKWTSLVKRMLSQRTR